MKAIKQLSQMIILITISTLSMAHTKDLNEVNRLISAWQTESAKTLLGQLVSQGQSGAFLNFTQGRLAFMTGHYQKAVQFFDQALSEDSSLE